MALILTRSPYLISNQGFTNAVMSLSIQEYNFESYPTNLKTYTLTFRTQEYIDISPLVRDYLIDRDIVRVNIVINGTPSGYYIASHYAVDGYGYYEEGMNKDFSSELYNNGLYAGSNNVIQRYTDKALDIPLLNPMVGSIGYDISENATNTLINFYKGSELVRTKTTNFGYFSTPFNQLTTADRIQYITESVYDTFEERVEQDGGTYETNSCIEAFLEEFPDEYTYYPATRVEIVPQSDYNRAYNLTVQRIDECKYTPHRIRFTNKLGVKENLWFFKKSSESIATEKESFRANTFNDYISGDLSNHVYRNYNLNGKESMTLNTGFVPESFKENFKQLMLSEKVWLDKDGIDLPINIKNSELELKKSVNDKLINYTIDIEFSYDKINNIF